MLSLFLVFALALANADVSKMDFLRAKATVPRKQFKGHGHAGLSETLNRHLRNSEQHTAPCETMSIDDLQAFMSLIHDHRSPELQEIYEEVKDRRTITRASLEDYRKHWATLNDIVSRKDHLYEPMRDSHCREAVMWWTHHLSEEKRNMLRSKSITVPELPETEVLPCNEESQDDEERHLCVSVNEPNSCDWCHSTQADHDAGRPNTSPPNALEKFDGPDDGNPHGWDITRRCDQDQMPRCKLCQGIGGHAYGDKPDEYDPPPCEVVATPSQVGCKDESGTPESCSMTNVSWPLYPRQFTVSPVATGPGYVDTLIGWKTDPFCFSFFPQNDSIPPLCYRSQDSTNKWYDIEREAARTDYNVKLTGLFSVWPNITASIMQVDWQMWIINHLWVVDQCVCTNPSGNHCTNPPCKSYIWRWDTFKTAQYLGREKIGVEWLRNAGVGQNSKIWELDHFIMWSHHAWTDPVSRRIVRMWKSFNGLQNYDPDAWTDAVLDPSVFTSPPDKCKKGGAPIRIHCDDNGNYDGETVEGMEHIRALAQLALETKDFWTLEQIKVQYEHAMHLINTAHV